MQLVVQMSENRKVKAVNTPTSNNSAKLYATGHSTLSKNTITNAFSALGSLGDSHAAVHSLSQLHSSIMNFLLVDEYVQNIERWHEHCNNDNNSNYPAPSYATVCTT